MTINVGDVIQVVLTWDGALSEVSQNVWHMEMVSGAGADEADILAALETQWAVAFADLDNIISNLWDAAEFSILKRDPVLHQWDGVGILGMTGYVGLGASDYLPHGVAFVLRYATQLNRRQGRMFVPGQLDSSVVAGVFTPANQVVLLAFAADWGTDISVTGGLLSLCTYNVDPTSVYYETSSLAAGTYVANSIPGYQRRRKPGVGI